MTEVKVKGSSEKLLPNYIEKCIWRERNGEEEPTTSNSTLMRIADLYSEDRKNHPVFFMITIDLDL